MKRLYFACLAALVYFQTAHPQTQHIFIDINTTISTQMVKASGYIGIMDALKFTAATGHKPDKSDLFQALMHTPATSTQQTYNDNLLMPTIFSDWLLGVTTNATIKTTMQNYLQTTTLKDIEKKVFSNIVDMMLTPEKLIDTQYVLKDTAKLLEKLKKSGLYTIYLVGNWDKESDPLLKNLLSDTILRYVDHVVFSHTIKHLKPSVAFFNHMLTSYKLKPENCLAIEIEPTYLQAAKEAGIKAIQFNPRHHKQLHQDLQVAGISL